MSLSLDRRGFLKTCTGMASATLLGRYRALAAAQRGRVKIRDIKVMMLQGPRTYTLVKVESDAGLYGIGEAYGNPGVGVKEGVLELRSYFLGKDPLDADALYVGLGQRIDGSAHMLLRATSGIEAALWDLAGKILDVPAATLLGGRIRNRVRMYHDEGPRNMLDPASCKDWAAKMKADPAGWTAFKFAPPRSRPDQDRARDMSNRLLTRNFATSGAGLRIAVKPSDGTMTSSCIVIGSTTCERRSSLPRPWNQSSLFGWRTRCHRTSPTPGCA
jgi:hypothetical protein